MFTSLLCLVAVAVVVAIVFVKSKQIDKLH